MSFRYDTLFWFWANQYVFLLLNDASLAKKQHIQMSVLGLTRSGLQPTIYNSLGDHASHNHTDAVLIIHLITAFS